MKAEVRQKLGLPEDNQLYCLWCNQPSEVEHCERCQLPCAVIYQPQPSGLWLPDGVLPCRECHLKAYDTPHPRGSGKVYSVTDRRFGAYSFDVDKAYKLAARYEPRYLDPAGAEERMRLAELVCVNVIELQHLAHIHTEQPAMVAHWFLYDPKGEYLGRTQALIDGSHRAALALRRHAPLAFYELSPHTTRHCLIQHIPAGVPYHKVFVR